jgi:hypothetical protein
MVALCLQLIAIIGQRLNGVALTSGRMQSDCMQFPYQGYRRLDDVTLASGRVQVVFPFRVCEGRLDLLKL